LTEKKLGLGAESYIVDRRPEPVAPRPNGLYLVQVQDVDAPVFAGAGDLEVRAPRLEGSARAPSCVEAVPGMPDLQCAAVQDVYDVDFAIAG